MKHALTAAFGAALLVLLSIQGLDRTAAAQDLQVTYGSNGVQAITYRGVTLEDLGAYPADAFHIWHMKSTDANGNPDTQGQYGWGESNNGRQWDGASHTMTYYFVWGSLAVHFAQNGNNLDMTVTETNNPGSGITFDGAEVYPFALHFPQDPAKFYGYTQYAITTTGPGVSVADYGSGVVTAVLPNESLPLYGGWKNTGGATYSPLMSGTTPDGLATFLPHQDLPVASGTSLSYTVSLRFTPEGTAADASDAYASFAATYPSQMIWTDKRIIGTAYLASSPSNGDITQPGGFPTNPRRYFNDSSVDITNPAGLQSFQNRMLQQAATNVANAQRLGGQGVITWDIEGEQYPQNTSYVCSPDQIASVAPEMESTISDSTSPYFGQKLDDAYFRTITSAGFKAGVCLRPQVFALGPNGTASQNFLSGNAAVIANLENKVRFANSRWSVTIFYVDSTVNSLGGTLDPSVFQQLITDFPAFLFIPEESTPRYYAYSAPFYSFLFHTDLGTPASVYNVYPNAFGANLVNDVSAGTLATYQPQLTQSVAKGDILMGHVDYWQQNNPVLVAIYAAAGVTSKPAPIQTTPTISWAAPASITYGTALGAAQLNATANTNGTFIYSPAAGTVLSAGNTTLTVTFNPADTATYKSTTAQVNLSVAQAVPTITWPTPASVVQGTLLSATQLNATANVPGSFTYQPAAGTVLSAGATSLTATFTPADATDYSAGSAAVNLLVTSAAARTPTLNWSNPAAVFYGTPLSGAQLNATASVPGTFNYSPSAGNVPSAGNHSLVAVFTPFDTAAYTSATASVNLQVLPATPVVTWSAPAAIVAGTALSAAQLNATANVPGSFTYTPGAGAVPAPGTLALQVTFVPSDTANYNTATASVPLIVTPPAIGAQGPVAVLFPVVGQTVSGTIAVLAKVDLPLDAAGSFLIVDGNWLADHRVTAPPFLYALDTTTLSNGPHTLQVWCHDIGNNTTISPPVTINVTN